MALARNLWLQQQARWGMCIPALLVQTESYIFRRVGIRMHAFARCIRAVQPVSRLLSHRVCRASSLLPDHPLSPRANRLLNQASSHWADQAHNHQRSLASSPKASQARSRRVGRVCSLPASLLLNQVGSRVTSQWLCPARNQVCNRPEGQARSRRNNQVCSQVFNRLDDQV